MTRMRDGDAFALYRGDLPIGTTGPDDYIKTRSAARPRMPILVQLVSERSTRLVRVEQREYPFS